MEAKTNYSRVGLTVIILAIALIICALWLSVGFEKKSYKLYAVRMHEAVSGLNEDSTVKYNGVPVGNVYKISLSRANPQEVTLLLSIVEGTPITTSTTATLTSQGITGTTFVGLAASSPDLTPLQKKPGEPYPVIPTRPSLYNQFDKILKDISKNINLLSKRLKKIVSEKNAKNIEASLENIQRFTRVLRDHDKDIGRTLKAFPALVAAIKQTSQDISSTMKTGKIAIDKISTQAIPPAVQLLNQLNNIAANIENMSIKMRQNPSVIIRGTTAAPSGPGEK